MLDLALQYYQYQSGTVILTELIGGSGSRLPSVVSERRKLHLDVKASPSSIASRISLIFSVYFDVLFSSDPYIIAPIQAAFSNIPMDF